MARHITVYRTQDLDFIKSPPTLDVYSEEFEQWLGEAQRRWLFEAPLGSEAAVRIYWSNPASELGLPLLAEIYEKGFYEDIKWSGEVLIQAEAEIEQLEDYRNSLNLSDEEYSYLQERTASLFKAIEIARINNGIVDIG